VALFWLANLESNEYSSVRAIDTRRSLVMDDSTISRIVVETEPDWLRIQDNVAKSMAASMETRLALLPGGKDGAESQALRKELEQRLAKVNGHPSSSTRSQVLTSVCRYKRRYGGLHGQI
jgi:hypothetical protein